MTPEFVEELKELRRDYALLRSIVRLAQGQTRRWRHAYLCATLDADKTTCACGLNDVRTILEDKAK